MEREIGEVFVDIGKLVIAGIILTGIMKQDVPTISLFVFGGAVAGALIFGGLFFIWVGKKKNNKKNKK